MTEEEAQNYWEEHEGEPTLTLEEELEAMSKRLKERNKLMEELATEKEEDTDPFGMKSQFDAFIKQSEDFIKKYKEREDTK